jgi:predicted O-linked N-acetylglucosamine transferase (SPINDLY family)
LAALPEARLMIKTAALEAESARRYTHQRFAARGIATERIELVGRDESFADHLGRYAQVDVVLDPFPYAGTTTTCEALWMGVPVVSLAGKTHVSRVGASLLVNAGLADLVAGTDAQYVQVACDLARDWERLAMLRSTMRARLEGSPLRDERGLAREVESAYRAMWRAYCTG